MNRRTYCEGCGQESIEVEGAPGSWCTNTTQHDTGRYVKMRPIPEGRKEDDERTNQ